jgi:hypothetical protein
MAYQSRVWLCGLERVQNDHGFKLVGEKSFVPECNEAVTLFIDHRLLRIATQNTPQDEVGWLEHLPEAKS